MEQLVKLIPGATHEARARATVKLIRHIVADRVEEFTPTVVTTTEEFRAAMAAVGMVAPEAPRSPRWARLLAGGQR